MGQPEQVILRRQLPGAGTPEVVQLTGQFSIDAQLSALFQKPLDVGGNITRKAALLQRRRQPPGEKVKWFTEFGHLNRGDMLTSEQHRCHNEKKKFQRRV